MEVGIQWIAVICYKTTWVVSVYCYTAALDLVYLNNILFEVVDLANCIRNIYPFCFRVFSSVSHESLHHDLIMGGKLHQEVVDSLTFWMNK